MKTVLILIAFALGLGASPSRADLTNPAPASAEAALDAATNATVSTFAKLWHSATDRLDLGGTMTAKRDGNNLLTAPSFSALGVVTKDTWHATARWDVDWKAGVAYTYVGKWDEHFAGIGAQAAVLKLPPQLVTAQNSVPLVDVVTPRLTVLSVFAAVELRIDNLHEPSPAATVGLTLPMGP